jgi:transposase
MKVESLLGLPKGFEVTSIERTDDGLTISVVSTQAAACCPLCSSSARRVHSHYTRAIADLPCAGQHVRLLLSVRKFFCEVKTCARKIFVERVAPFVEPWARVTARLYQSVQVIGFATGGMLGARLTDQVGIRTCWMTIIRRMMALPTEPVEHVVELGIDDFSFRRGRKFGSILVDMQSHKVIDLLPDRKAETAKVWMQNHPEIDLVSRDRGGDYASGAREGAPQATQVADRFHFYKNLGEAVERTLACCRAEIRSNAQLTIPLEEREVSKPLRETTEFVCVENWKPAPDVCAERERMARRAERYDRYQQVISLHTQGFGSTEIALRVGLTARTIQRWLKEDAFRRRTAAAKTAWQF